MSNIKFDFPTEIIDLPSKGLVYPEGHPLRKGNVEIKYMTAREEDILASQTLIKKGMVLDKLFESIVVEVGVNINDIFIGDKNAILMATRVLGYGADYTVEINDPFTLEKQSVTIDLSKVKTKDFNEALLNGENRYKFKLPKSGNEVVFKLLTHGDEAEISKEIQSLERLYKGKGEKTFDVTTRLKYMIQSVDGNEDRGFITKWIQNSFLALDTKAFRKYVKELSPDMDLTFNFISDITGEEEALDIPFGINFFYPSE
jgi:hypothetical protein|tara:strand:+ start:4212 stop:4985 length:774 start_codon:yes stop_codon:yes gene_type:complete